MQPLNKVGSKHCSCIRNRLVGNSGGSLNLQWFWNPCREELPPHGALELHRSSSWSSQGFGITGPYLVEGRRLGMLSVLQCTEQPLTPQPKMPGASPRDPTGKHFHTTSNSPFPSSQLSDHCHASLLLRRQPEQSHICGADTRLGQCSGTSQRGSLSPDWK